ncbi:MAG: GAF domain-containing protein, partial [Anaerolineales bacterium]|nr:GAF domain-containing protein [Anaerolineales bacterium]
MSDALVLTPPTLERRLADLSALVQVIKQINRSLDPENVFHTSLEGIRQFVGGEFGCFLLLQNNTSALELKNADGLSAPLLAQLQKISPPETSAEVPPENQAALLAEIGHRVGQVLEAQAIQSSVILPLTARGRAIGILVVGAGKVLTPLGIDLLMSIGEQIGMAIENARLHTALAESEEWHRAFIENSPDGFMESGEGGRILYVNDAGCKILGYSRDEILQMRRDDFLEFGSATSDPILAELYQRGSLASRDLRVRAKSGATRIVNFAMRMVCDARGETLRRQSVFRDVTEQFEVLDQLRQRTQEQAALNTIAGILNHPLEIAHSLDQVCEQITTITGLETVGLYLLDESAQRLNLLAQRGLSSQLLAQGYHLGLDDLAVSTIMIERKTIALNDVTEFPDATSFAGPRAEGYHAGIGVPILRRGVPAGAIYVGSKAKTRYEQSDVDLLQNIANQIGVALENVDLYTQMQRRMAELDGLAQLSAACATKLDPQAISKLTIEWTKKLLSANLCVLRLIENDQLRFGAGVADSGVIFQETMDLDAIRRQVIENRQSFKLDDAETFPALAENGRQELARLGVRAFLVAPLQSQERVIGVLTVGYSQSHPWSSNEIDLLQTIANQAANAIDNAQLYQNALTEKRKVQAIFDSGLSGLFATDAAGRIVMFNRAAERITGWTLAEVEGKSWKEILSDHAVGNPVESLMEQALLHKQITYAFEGRKMRTKDGRVIPVAKASAPLLDEKENVIGAVGAFWDLSKEQRAEIEYENFLAMIAHQLRSPLSSVLSALELFERRNLSDARRAELWTIIRAEGNQLKRLADQFLEHETALKSARPVKLETLSVARVARQLVRQFRANHHAHHFQVRVPNPEPWALADSQGVENVLRNLLDNAVIYAPPDSRINIRINAPDPDWIVVSVQDFGIGIPLSEQPHLFKPFYRVPQT